MILSFTQQLERFYHIYHIFLDEGFVVCVISPDAPVYLSSQSYMADSSLSEEMSQFDFSTGVQSFSFSSQNPEGRRRTLVKRVRLSFFFHFVDPLTEFVIICVIIVLLFYYYIVLLS